MEVVLMKPELRDKWLRMRIPLWPECSPAEHRSEVDQYFIGGSGMAVFAAVRPDGSLCGFLEATIHPLAFGCETGPVGYIEGWYVAPDLRRHGVGRKLVEAAEAWAVTKGCREMASDCLIDNIVSMEAHLSLGYEEIERLIHFRKVLAR